MELLSTEYIRYTYRIAACAMLVDYVFPREAFPTSRGTEVCKFRWHDRRDRIGKNWTRSENMQTIADIDSKALLLSNFGTTGGWTTKVNSSRD